MNELLRNKKTKRNIILIFLLTLFICISSMVLMCVFTKIDDNSEQLSNSIETQWRAYTRVILSEFESELLEEINSSELDPYNDDELNSWIVDNLPFLKKSGMIDNFAIMNIGYKLRDKSMNLELSFLNNSDTLAKDRIEQSYKSILSDINGKDIKYVIQRITEEAQRINSEIQYISVKEIKDLYIEALLLNNEGVGSSNMSISELDDMHDSDKYWTESITIPNGILGFDSQPPYINNEANPIYRKVVVYVSVDKDTIMSEYDILANNTNELVNISIVILVFMTVLCIVIIAILFVNTINMNGGVYDADDAHENSCRNDDDSGHIDLNRT